jgi:hypothetical protein
MAGLAILLSVVVMLFYKVGSPFSSKLKKGYIALYYSFFWNN